MGSSPSRVAGLVGDEVLVMEIDPEERLVWREPRGKLPLLLFENPLLGPICWLLLWVPNRLLDRAAAPPSAFGLGPCPPSPFDLSQPPSVGRERLPLALGTTLKVAWTN